MGYLNDYLYYGSGNECPESFQLWSSLSLLGAVLGRRVWVNHGSYWRVYPNIYVCLVGTAGSGKSSAKSVAKTIFVKAFPNYMISASIQSREDIIDLMATDECVHTWKDIKGEIGPANQIYEFRPFYIIANELASFLSVDKGKMVEFLVDVYDENYFSTGFKGQRQAQPGRKQHFENPHVSMLACTVPKWFMSNLKLDLFDGGLGRRLIIVYDEKSKQVPEPFTPPGGNEALLRAVDHLRAAEKLVGEIKRSDDAMKFWREWYVDPRRINREDPILMQFHETKPIQVLKVAMLLSLSEQPFKMQIDGDHLQAAVKMLDALEPNVVRLTSGIGRNELAGAGAQILDFLERFGGFSSEVQLKKHFHRYLRTPEFIEVLAHYQETGQLVVQDRVDPSTNVSRRFYCLPNAAQRLTAAFSRHPASNGPLPESSPDQATSTNTPASASGSIAETPGSSAPPQ